MSAKRNPADIAPGGQPNLASQQVHLFFEQPVRFTKPVPVLEGVHSLDGVQGALRVSSGNDPNHPRMEPVVNRQGHVRLLLASSNTVRARVNGRPAPLLAVLKERDFVQWPGGAAAHVSVLNRPRIGRPPGELLGRECPVCRVPFTPHTRCYQCSCGAGFHIEEEAEGLQCLETRTECDCGRPIVRVEGFSYQPDLNNE